MIRLTAQNVGKLKYVALQTGRPMTYLSGRNDQGKSTVLNLFNMFLSAKAVPEEPIRKGQKTASAVLELDTPKGPVTATLRFTEKNKRGSLDVVFDGKPQDSPRNFLQALLGPFSFDIRKFIEADSSEQFQMLIQAMKINFDQIEFESVGVENPPDILSTDDFLRYWKRVVEEITTLRRDVNRDLDKAKKLYDPSLQAPSGLQADLQTLLKAQKFFDSKEDLARQGRESKSRIEELKEEIEKLTQALEAERKNLETIAEKYKKLTEDPPKFSQEEVTRYLQDYSKEDESRRIFEKNEENRKVMEQLQVISDKHSATLDALQKFKLKKLQESDLHIPDLEFDEDRLIYRGLPLKQAVGTAEGYMLSFRIMSALKKSDMSVKCVVIDDANLVSEDNLRIIEQEAADKGWEVLLALVTSGAEDSESIGFVLEDGEIVKNTYEASDGQDC